MRKEHPVKSKNHERRFIKFVESGLYEITENGEVWRTSPVKKRAEQLNKLTGYWQVLKRINGKTIHCPSHRLIWQYLHGDIPSGLVINHKDGNPSNNHPDNLELNTFRMNLDHGHGNYHIGQGRRVHWKYPFTDRDIENIRYEVINLGTPMWKMAKIYQTYPQMISEIVSGKRWPLAGGLIRNDTYKVLPCISCGRLTLLYKEYDHDVWCWECMKGTPLIPTGQVSNIDVQTLPGVSQ